MWFVFSIISLLCWSGADLFCKLGCQGERDRYSALKMVMAVGAVMGLHALWSIFVGGVEMNARVLAAYLPVSLLYISSMAVGYLGMRYIELSVSSPVCNSSGAVTVILLLLTRGAAGLPMAAFAAVALICAGVIGLGFAEATEDEELRRARQDSANRHYAKSPLAIALPLIYCLLDALGTFADSILLETLNEDSANAAYELTFLAVGLVCAVYVIIGKKQKFTFRMEAPKCVGAVFETVGQFFYIYALADSTHAAVTVPLISGYSVGSMLLAAVFLKEKLSKKHWISVSLVIIGIIILAILDI